jgi:hypothetical protein
MDEQDAADESQLVVFKFLDGKEYDGSVKQLGNGYELAVDDVPEQAWPPIDRLEARVKKSDDKYLFLDVHCRGRSWHSGKRGESSTTHFVPTTTLYTNEPDNPLSQKVTSIDARIDCLDLWLNKSLFAFESSMKLSGNVLKYSTQEQIGRYRFKDFELTFELAIGGMQFWRFTREVSLKQGGHVGLQTVEGADDVAYQEFVEVLRSVERLLSLAFRSPIRTIELDVASKEFGLSIGDNPDPIAWPTYSITLSDARPAAPQVRLGDEPAFTLDNISDFQGLLDKWIAVEEQITPVVDLFLISVSGGSTVLENIFLNRIQAIEGFHRSFRPGSTLPEEEYDEQKDRIVGQFAGAENKAARNLLQKVLKHGNDLSLADRLGALNTELQLKGIATITACDMGVVANTRNYYSHYEKDITNICPGDKLMQLTHEAGQMLFALILTELGIGDEVVRKAVKRVDIINPF